MLKIFGILFFLTAMSLYGQEKIKIYKPTSYYTPDLSKSTENEINRQNELLDQKNLTNEETVELDRLLKKYGETYMSVWGIIEGGCSWYCGGGNYKVVSSSNLRSQEAIVYTSRQANDLDYKTAWVEGVNGPGIGEYLEFFFEDGSPRINSIIVSNGYFKSESAWKNNNRVKSLMLWINGKEFGKLELTDSKTDQKFEIGVVEHSGDGKDLVLRFEILDIYKGDKYDDTVITEIYFDGIDVH